MKLSRTLILLALAAVLPLVVLAAVLGAVALRQQQQALVQEASARVSLASGLLERELAGQVALLTSLAQSPLFDGSLDQDLLSTYLDRVRKQRPGWRALVVNTASGDRVARVAAAAAYPNQIAEMDSFRRVVETGRPVVGRIMRRPNGLLSFALRVPVIRDGKLIYVISAAVSPDGIRTLMLGRALPEGWAAGVLDDTGRIVARINAPQEAVGGFASPTAMRAATSGQDGGLYDARSLEGLAMVSAFKRLPAYGWSVHTAIPRDLYRAPLVRALWLVAACTLLSLLLAGVFLLLLARELRLRRREEATLEEGRRMEALGRMTGGVAHDFNNLLMIVQGSAEMLKRRREEPARVGAYADAILSASQRGQSLTRQLLAFARRSAHEPVDFRLQDRAGDLRELVRRAVRDDIGVDIAIPDDAWPVRADPDALAIALINLAVNAADAMPDGGDFSVKVANQTVAGGRGASPSVAGDYLTITARDTGGGIADEHLGHIFEPFYTTKAAGRGTGLGLSQVYGFARQSGGVVTVASRPGEGATFVIYLPRALDAVLAPAVPSKPAAAPPTASGRLLLVEDSPEVAETLRAMLVLAGYTVTVAANGPTAMALIDGDMSFDAVLSDVVMEGGVSGLELADLLAARRPDLPVVLMSGHAGILTQPAPSGAVILAKPFRPADVTAALARAQAAQQAAEKTDPASALRA